MSQSDRGVPSAASEQSPMKSERSDADGKENRTWQRAGQPVFIK